MNGSAVLPRRPGSSLQTKVLLYVAGAFLLMVLLEDVSDALTPVFLTEIQRHVVDSSSLAVRLSASNILWDVVDFPLWLAVACLLAWFVTWSVLRPFRDLADALDQCSQEPLPETVAVLLGKGESVRLALSFNRLIHALHDLVDREKVFTYFAMHELLTPLSTLERQIATLEAGSSPAADAEVMPAISHTFTRVHDSFATLLALTHRPETDPAPVALTSLIGRVLRSLPEEAQARVQIEVRDYPGGRLRVPRARLAQQAIRTLLEHALARSSDPVSTTVAITAEQIVIRVMDSGPALPETHIDALGRAHFHLNDHLEGPHPELALVQHIARSLGGTLELVNVTSGLEAGLFLPIYSYVPKPGDS